MVFNWTYFLVGLLLLWFPRSWMRLGMSVLRRRRRGARSEEPWLQRTPGDPRLSFRREFARARNYLDLLRGAAGGLAMVGFAEIPASVTMAAGGDPRAFWIVFGLKLGAVLGGVLIQTIRVSHGHVAYFPPVFFLAGLSVALCGPWAALFAFMLVWSVNAMLPNPQAFLSLDALLMIGFGVLLRQVDRNLAIAAGIICFLPALLSWMTRRPLVIFSRRGFHSDSRVS
jgi:hypothetical protein